MSIDNDLLIIGRQEEALRFTQFSSEMAWRIGERLRRVGAELGLPVVVDVRRFGEPLFYSALAGAVPDNAEWVRRKSNVVARFYRSSYAVGLEMKKKGTTLLEQYALPDADYAAHGGAFPIHVINAGVIGSVTVSGLPQRADHELVVQVLCEQLGVERAPLAMPIPIG